MRRCQRCHLSALAYVLTAFALRGGNVGWPWSLLAFASLGWLMYGAAPMVGGYLGVDESMMRAFGAALRTFACLAQMSAGLLQALVVMEPELPLPRAPAGGWSRPARP